MKDGFSQNIKIGENHYWGYTRKHSGRKRWSAFFGKKEIRLGSVNGNGRIYPYYLPSEETFLGAFSNHEDAIDRVRIELAKTAL